MVRWNFRRTVFYLGKMQQLRSKNCFHYLIVTFSYDYCYHEKIFSAITHFTLDYQIIYPILLGIALAACCGFRIFLPFLAVAIASQLNWIEVSPSMQWISSWQAITCFAVAATAEIVAYYVPFLDNVLDTITTPLAVVAGTILASAIIPFDDGNALFHWGLSAISGGTLAGSIQGGTGFIRLFSTKATVGAGNVLIASVENAAAVTGIFLSFAVPLLAFLLLATIALWFLWKAISRLTNRAEKIF